MADIESYIFGAGTPNLDYQALAQRRAIAQALAGRKRDFPKTIGEGMTALGEALGERFEAERIGRAAAGQRAAESKLIGGAPEGPAYTGTLPGAAPAGAPRADLTIEPQLAPGFYAGGDDEALANKRAAGIGGIETGGQANPYQALGPVTKTGDRAYGRYQVMGANIPAWSKAALGAELTPEQFLASKEAQDDIFRNQFGGYADKYGEQGAARAWLGGEGSIDKPGRADQLGTTVGAYGDRYMASLSGAGAPAPTRMAAINLPGSTISDAVPTAAAPAARANPATVVADIKPAASSLPSSEPIPPASEQKMEPPGDPPKRPGIIGPTKPMTYWSNIMNNPNVSPGMQNYAKQKFEQESSHLGGIQKRQDEDFTHERDVWQKKSEAWDKFTREAPDRAIAQLKERLAVQTSQLGIDKTTLEIAKVIHERDGGAWDDALAKGRAEAITARRTAVKPETASMRGTTYERIADPKSGELGPFNVAPGAPAPEEKPMTAEQAKAYSFVRRVRPDLLKLEHEGNHGEELTNPAQHALQNAPLPDSVKNMMVSDKYRAQRDQQGNWGAGFLNFVSGATVTPGEALIQLPAFMPRPGDTKADLIDKTRRKKDFTDAAERVTSEEGRRELKEMVDKANAEYTAKKAVIDVTSEEDAKKLPVGSRYRLDGRTGTVH